MMLKFDGHHVETACSASEALALFQREKFSLVVTDYSMPLMKGDELAQAIKYRAPEQKIGMISAYGEVFKAQGRTLAGVDFLLNKPFCLQALREAIASACTSPRELSQHPSHAG